MTSMRAHAVNVLQRTDLMMSKAQAIYFETLSPEAVHFAAIVNASSEQEVLQTLRDNGHYPLAVYPADPGWFDRIVRGRKPPQPFVRDIPDENMRNAIAKFVALMFKQALADGVGEVHALLEPCIGEMTFPSGDRVTYPNDRTRLLFRTGDALDPVPSPSPHGHWVFEYLATLAGLGESMTGMKGCGKLLVDVDGTAVQAVAELTREPCPELRPIIPWQKGAAGPSASS